MRLSLEDIKHMVKPIQYPKLLPAELKEYHAYISDGGHCIMCVLEMHLENAVTEGVEQYELPVPVKYVLEKGYKVTSECVIVSAEYDIEFGLDIPDGYEEF